ncbi:MAG: heparinase II/III family protein [Candidatus Accumulibacter sp. UW20]|jgi:hypothetical protein
MKTDQKNAVLRSRARLLRRPQNSKFYHERALAKYEAEAAFDVRPPHPPLVIEFPVDWFCNPYNDKTWRLYFYSFGWLNVLCFGINKYARSDPQRSAQLLAMLHRTVLDGIEMVLVHRDNKVVWGDHATSYRTSNLSYFYAAFLCRGLTPEEDQFYRRAIGVHMEIVSGFLESKRWRRRNHLLFHAEGLADACFVFGDGLLAARQGMELAVAEASIFVEECFTDDGTVHEHASWYHVFLMQRVMQTVDYFSSIGQPIVLISDEKLDRAATFLWSICPRWGILPGYGDTQFEKKIDFQMLRQYLMPERANVALRQWLETSAVDEPPRLSAFPRGGYYIFREGRCTNEDALYSLFLEKRALGPHAHCDGGSFMTFFGGEPYLIDSGGPYKYHDPLRYKYFRTQLAHNTVAFVSEGDEYSTCVQRADVVGKVSYVVSDAEFSRGDRWRRVFGHASSMTVFIIDFVHPVGELPPVALFHVSPDLQVGIALDSYQLQGRSGTCLVTFADPDGPVQCSERPEPGYAAFVTRSDVGMEPGRVLTRRLQQKRPNLTMLSFDGSRAARVRQIADVCEIDVQSPAGKLTRAVIKIPHH